MNDFIEVRDMLDAMWFAQRDADLEVYDWLKNN